ncbi:MAG: diadenosine tetraphosphate hydrolase [Candidatus Magasanikbacteria bacterium RIFCSPHIGHO2_02_FULL_41_13]|uniref:Diadenosine tetraphosphate hydrolase n=1 Tax=Candidatus Magasanikbacteria bacterium RIFCSPHIGHO2_02_FULL_41_13 TaxID=1798676 RepID=A0A1F6M2V5_9BACT|nr:MAG: diadenosine tetraphosphate hydrolase [Candidatus Magasanikbacteria bacterium RIFCSPHIGHO2_02_FULL_41_13]
MLINCIPCERISQIQQGSNPYFVVELKTGYVVLGDHQFYKGYTIFHCKEHKRELHELDPEFRFLYLKEMSVVAEAVFTAFHPVKLNYALLGNADEHLHWHIFPRYDDDPLPKQPVWQLDKSIRTAESTCPSIEELDTLKQILLLEIFKIIGSI